jgi:hypothetical protein
MLEDYILVFFNMYNLFFSTLENNIPLINFKFISEYEKISTENFKESFYNYLREMIKIKINNLNKSQYEQIFKILKDNDIKPDTNNEFSIDKIIETINQDDFYSIDEILDVVYLEKEYKEDNNYKKLLELSKLKLSINPIQIYTNKLFLQMKENKKIYYLFFSFGNLKHIKNVNWKNELKKYIILIKKLINEDNFENLILCGHSIGSIVIQYLAIELLNNNIDVSRIFVIGSGCITNEVLSKIEIEKFKINFRNRFFFVINSYLENDKIFYDSITEINEINTHLLICNDKDFKNCHPILYSIKNIEDLIISKKYEPINNIILHEFLIYSNLYLNQIGVQQGVI